MNTKTLLTIFSMTEILLLVILGVLSDKLAELIQLKPITILILTLVLIMLLAGITFYKFRIADSRKKTISLPKSKARLTQHGVNKSIWWLGYGPFALMLSLAAFHLSEELDPGWHALLPGIAVSGTLFAYPAFRHQAIEDDHKMLPLFVAWILSVMYGGTGFMLVLIPNLLERYLPVFIMISVVTMAGLKYA